jgi:hypothetical protein
MNEEIEMFTNWFTQKVVGAHHQVYLNYDLTPDDESPIPHCVLPVCLFAWSTDDALSAQSCL